MLIGTIGKLNAGKRALVETYYLSAFDPKYITHDCFCLVILKDGSVTARIGGRELHIQSPAVLCLDETKTVQVLQDNSTDVRMIKFDPQFLNVNLKLDTIRSSAYEHLSQRHAFFQLSPFLNDDAEKMCVRLNGDALEKIEDSFDRMTESLLEQEDWYWSCRARSYFIDLINVIERLYHNFYVRESEGAKSRAAMPGEWRKLLTYINTHLDQKLTLDVLYSMFHINKNHIEELFRKHLDTTFYDYLRTRRYEEAAHYLRYTELGGKEIAARIGLSSSQNFCKFFKAMSGSTPNEFRREVVAKRKSDPELIH